MVERFICQTGSPAGTWDSTTDAVSASTIMSCSIGILTSFVIYILFLFLFENHSWSTSAAAGANAQNGGGGSGSLT